VQCVERRGQCYLVVDEIMQLNERRVRVYEGTVPRCRVLACGYKHNKEVLTRRANAPVAARQLALVLQVHQRRGAGGLSGKMEVCVYTNYKRVCTMCVTRLRCVRACNMNVM
jgi:hypothetical protein